MKTLVFVRGGPGEYAAVVDVDGARYTLYNTERLSETEWLSRVADTPPPIVSEDVVAELLRLKPEAIGFIKSNPDATLDECLTVFQPTFLNPMGVIARYIEVARLRGLIHDATFEAFRALILAMTPEQLLEL